MQESGIYHHGIAGILLGLSVILTSCGTEAVDSPAGLKDVYADAFMIGTALNTSQINEEDVNGVNW
jgi:hypothetical protein